MHLSRFKEAGLIKFERSLRIPMNERIPALVKDSGHEKVLTAIVASIMSAFNNINLKKGMNEDQVIELAAVLIDEAHNDQLALEDILLFLQRLITGQAGTLYDRLDMPTFFELFESYREERYQALRHIREEEHANYKCIGPSNRSSDQIDDNYRSALNEHYKNNINAQSGNQQPATKA